MTGRHWQHVQAQSNPFHTAPGPCEHGVAVTDPEGNVLLVSAAQEETFGIAPGEVVGRNLRESLPWLASQEATTEVLREVVERGSWRGQTKAFNRHGAEVSLEIRASLVSDEHGRTPRLVFLIRDTGLERHAADLKAVSLSAIAEAAHRHLGEEEFFSLLGTRLREMGYLATILMADESEQTARVVYASASEGGLSPAEASSEVATRSSAFDLASAPAMAEALREDRAIFLTGSAATGLLRQVLSDGRGRDLSDDRDTLSTGPGLVIAPIPTSQRPRGVLMISGPGLSQANLPLVAELANSLAIALDNARVYEAALWRERFSETLRRIAEAATSGMEQSQLLDMVCREALELFDVTYATVRLLEGDKIARVARASRPGWSLPPELGYVKGSLTEHVVRERRVIIVNDVDTYPLLINRPHWERIGIQSDMMIPLIVNGQTIGALNLMDCQRKYRFSQEMAEAAEILGSSVAMTIQRVEAQRQVQILSSAVERAGDAIRITDIHRRALYVNDAWCQLSGYARHEVVGQDNEMIRPLEVSLEEWSRPWKECMERGTSAGEAAIRRKDGALKRVWYNFSLIPDSSGAPAAIVVIDRDLTERRQMEEHLQRLVAAVESASDGLSILDLEGRYLYVNQATADRLGYTREELVGLTIRDVAPEGAQERLAALRETGHWDGEITQKRKDGAEIPVWLKTSVIKDEQGTPVGFVAGARDLSERKELEEQLVQSEKLRALGEMAAGVAHDFNNVLASAMGNTELLMRKVSDGDTLHSLGLIRQAILDGAETVKRLQEFTRGGESQEGTRPVDLTRVVRQAVEITRPRWRDLPQGQGVDIEVEVRSRQAPWVLGRASELREVMVNLINNAVDAMPQGGKVTIETRLSESRATITVTDTGTGMDEETCRRAFEPFFTTKGSAGSGLGLSVVHGIILSHGGDISVRSAISNGTTFTVSLPAAAEMEVKQPEPVRPEAPDAGRRLTALVIDDEPVVGQVLKEMLEQHGHKATVWTRAEDALEDFLRGEYDLVFTDLGMPGINGWDMCKAVKSHKPGTPVIMITGWGTHLDEEKMSESGVDFAVAKPLRYDDLRAIVNRALPRLPCS